MIPLPHAYYLSHIPHTSLSLTQSHTHIAYEYKAHAPRPPRIRCAQGALPVVVPQRPRVEGVAAQEVQCRELQGRPAHSAAGGLEHVGLRRCAR